MRRRDQADEQRDQHRDRDLGAGVVRERLQRDDDQQEDQRQHRQQDVERDLVRRLLPGGAFDQRDHPIEERVAGIGGDLDHDPVGDHARAAGDRRTVAARFADHRRRFAGDRRFVHRGDALDDLAVGGDELAGDDADHVALAQAGRRHRLGAAVGLHPVGDRLGAGLAQGVGLGLAPALGHRLGEVGEEHGEPQPEGHLAGEERPAGAGQQLLDEHDRRQQAADLDDEHDRVLDLGPRVEFPQRVQAGLPDDAGIPDRDGTSDVSHGAIPIPRWRRRAPG